MENKRLQYTRSQVRRAGKLLVKQDADLAERIEALQVVDDWRAAHAYPLRAVATGLRNKNKCRGYIIVQRLKRLDSIINKLERNSRISLSHMQDLAGCRVIVPTVEEVYSAFEEYEGSRKKHMLHHVDDYIKQPKASGYRGIHAIYKYHSEKNVECDGMFVEIQFRTQLQHLWSTAVETMGIYTGKNLKAGCGPEHVLRFFSLISSAFAMEEGQETVPNTPKDLKELMGEIRRLCNEDNILEALRAIRVATQEIVRRGNNAEYYILILNFNNCTLRIKEYSEEEFGEATKAYGAIENQNKEDKINAVLVSASSIDELRDAYPNYFADIGAFVKRVEYILATDGSELRLSNLGT